MWNEYFAPAGLDEAAALLAQHAPAARIIAGGTDLVIELERGVRPGQMLIDISRLRGLDGIRLDGAGWIHLGPLVTHADVVGSTLCAERAFPLARACREVGAPQIRNRATVAGNLITASPANDTITPLMALGARVTLLSARGQRDVALSDFYTGVRRTAMAPDELLVDIAFPALGSQQRGTFIKLGLRRAQAISLVNCAVVLTFASASAGAPVAQAAIALGAVAPVIIRAADAEAALAGRALNTALIERAAALAQAAARPIDDVRASAAYRRDMVGVLVSRALTQLMDGTERADWQPAPALLTAPAPPASSAPLPPISPSQIRLTVNGREYAIDNPDAHEKTLLRLARGCRADRDERGLRGRRVRRVHGHHGRQGGDVVPGAGPVRAWRVYRHHRGAGPGRPSAPAAAGLHRRRRGAVRLLHAGVHHGRRRIVTGAPASRRGADSREHQREPVPLHRLLQNPQRLPQSGRHGASAQR